jgi:Holliday junction resolvasome RuvABC endonuclease subunit
MNSKVGTHINEVIGVVNLATAYRKLDIFSYSPSEIKLAVTGYGGATKDDVLMGIDRYTPSDLSFYSDHESDAAATALTYCIKHLKVNTLNKRAVNVAVKEVLAELEAAKIKAALPKAKLRL